MMQLDMNDYCYRCMCERIILLSKLYINTYYVHICIYIYIIILLKD